MREWKKKALLVFVFIVLSLPYLQHRFKVIDSGSLRGFYTTSDDVDLTWKGWFDESYQTGKNNFYNDHIGFREDLVRLSAQINFSFFRKLEYASSKVDKNGSLIASLIVNSYYGKDFLGYDSILRKVIMLKALQDTFGKLGKSLILVHTPCKAFYNAEEMAELMGDIPRKPNNFETVLHYGDSLGVNQVNLNAWFVSMKYQSKELIFSKQGVHWTVYGSILGGDSIVKFIERLRKVRMLHPTWTKIERTSEARDTDNDLAIVLNLIFPVTEEIFSYPEVHYPVDATAVKPNIIYIGDSFVMNLLRNGMMDNVHDHWEFWYYFGELHNRENPGEYGPPLSKYDWHGAIDKADCIVLAYTAHNIRMLGNGFIEQAYRYYYPETAK